MIDRYTTAQVETVITASLQAIEQICEAVADKGVALAVTPPSMFLAFAAVSQLLKKTPDEQLRLLNAGLKTAGDVIGERGAAKKFGKGRPCAGVTLEMAQKACELAKRDVDATNLVPHRQEARDKLLFKALLEFAVVAKILEPKGLSNAMNQANELCAQVIASGWLTRNEIKLGEKF